MSVSAAIRRMLEQGFSIEQALDAAEVFEQEAVRPVDKRKERNRRYYEKRKTASKSVLKASETSYSDVQDTLPLEGSPAPLPKNPNPQSPSSLRSSGDARAREEFHANFWPDYPHKVGKPGAEKAFVKARRQAPLSVILAGLKSYIDRKPPERAWLNPATFLNGQRWTDSPAEIAPHGQGPPGLFRTSDGILAALKRHLDEDDDSESGDQPRDHQDPYDTLFRLASKGHDGD